MKISVSPVRLAVFVLSLPAASAVLAQTGPTPALNEVVVTGSRVAGPLESQPFGTSVITDVDIQRIGAVTVNDAIMRLLGVVGRQDFYGGGDYALDLRGFGSTASSNQVVIVDGVRITEADLSGTRLAGIPIESVSQIEVIRGSGAVLYGEGATGGVIIITTKAGAGAARKNAASLYAGVGSYGLREGRANATLASGGFSLDVNAMNRKADNHRDNFRSETDAVSAVTQWSNEWLRVGASRAQDSLDTGLPGGLTAAQYQNNPRQTTTPQDKASIDNVRNGLFAEASLGDWQLLANAGWRDKKLRSTSAFGAFDYDVKATDYGLRAVHGAKQPAFSNRLVLGTDYASWQRDVLGAFGSTATQASRAFYFRDELTVASMGTVLSVGARTERIKKDITGTSSGIADRQNAWELGLSQPLNKEVSVYGRVGRSFRLANADEFSFTSPGVTLLPQRSTDVELGSRYASGPVKMEARLYRSALTHEIGFDPNAADPFGGNLGANVNFDPTRRSGLEVDGSYAYAANLNLRVNAALRKSTFSSGPNAGKEVPLAPNRTFAVHADWTPLAGHLVSGGLNWVSSQHPDFANQCSIPAYTTADARYAYQWQNVEVSLGITNLFDRKFYTQAFRCAAGVTASIYPEAGRAVVAAVRLKF
ncbi:TonB-dependent receptor [Polaromonas jejuensis]|uniref:TonB-dependent receptor n=1 Tax=Polaromonas jejuensis TaxID=457502 RepID=A0ABW0QJ66_9BURK|nr:TonB-dependent receptor [Polaromonas jejuensis]